MQFDDLPDEDSSIDDQPFQHNNDLDFALAWLDAHINYERNGPGNKSLAVNDPERRMLQMAHLVELLDDPQKTFPSVHITGTNGKTSTSRMLTQLFLSRGLRTGTYTSPHLERLNERIAVNGDPISDSEMAELLESVRLIEVLMDATEQPSYFELLTAAAFRYFSDAPVDVGIIEVGAGGRYDATNVVDAHVAVITNIGDDHHEYLGPTRKDIAWQKAGIIKPGSTLVTSETDPELLAIFESEEHAKTLAIGRDFEVLESRVAVGGRLLDLRTPRARYEEVFLSAHGAHQATNALTALVAAEEFFESALSETVVKDAFATIETPGRFEVVGKEPVTIIDGAHNVEGAKRLVATLDEELAATPNRIFVIGMLSPHQPGEMLEALQAAGARLLVACTAPSPRAVPAHEIARAAQDLGVPVAIVEDVAAAVAQARSAAGDEDAVVITGSLYVAGAARTVLATA